jgi:hypothetical protein
MRSPETIPGNDYCSRRANDPPATVVMFRINEILWAIELCQNFPDHTITTACCGRHWICYFRLFVADAARPAPAGVPIASGPCIALQHPFVIFVEIHLMEALAFAFTAIERGLNIDCCDPGLHSKVRFAKLSIV